MKPTTKPERTPEQRAEEEAIRRQHAVNPVRQRPAGTINQQSFAAILSLMAQFKAVRENQGLTLAEVADRMGIDAPALSRLENGKVLNPTLATLLKWAEALGQELAVGITNTLTTKGGCDDGREGEPMSFPAIIRHYKERWLPTSEFGRFRSMHSLDVAIEAAALSVDENGNTYDHQLDRVRRPVADFRKAADALLEKADRIEACRNFDELLDLVEAVIRKTFPGSNKELYVYDVAFRISAYLSTKRPKLLPEKVYLHRGTKKGAEALGIKIKAEGKRRRAVEMHELPPELQSLPAWQLEDILCLYCKRFPKNWSGKQAQ
jgi:transcriptional regulator with XRE-family HTH domain